MGRWMGKLRKSSRDDDAAKRKLEALAAEFGLPLDELLSWYRDDLSDIAGLPINQLRSILDDYAQNRDFYQKRQRAKQ